MFLYDSHVHSSECSKCADNTAMEMVRGYKQQGYSGFVLTNHFYHGNTGVDRSLPWGAFVDTYVRAFEQAREQGAKCDFDVIFGLEEGIGNGKEMLCYDFDVDELRRWDDWRTLSPTDRIARMKEAGALVIYAHPFRFRDYMGTYVEPVFDGFDGVEVFNAMNEGDENGRALLAGVPDASIRTAGNDAHNLAGIAGLGLYFHERVKDAARFAQLLRDGAYRLKVTE